MVKYNAVLDVQFRSYALQMLHVTLVSSLYHADAYLHLFPFGLHGVTLAGNPHLSHMQLLLVLLA